jgi:hypothetical protein
LAQTNDRWLTLKRLLAETKVRDIECHLLTPDECKEKCPLIRVDDLEGGNIMPNDYLNINLSIFPQFERYMDTRRWNRKRIVKRLLLLLF